MMDYIEPLGIIGKNDPLFKLHSLAEILIIQLCENSHQGKLSDTCTVYCRSKYNSWNRLEAKIYSQPLHKNDSNKNFIVENQDMRIMFICLNFHLSLPTVQLLGTLLTHSWFWSGHTFLLKFNIVFLLSFYFCSLFFPLFILVLSTLKEIYEKVGGLGYWNHFWVSGFREFSHKNFKNEYR